MRLGGRHPHSKVCPPRRGNGRTKRQLAQGRPEGSSRKIHRFQPTSACFGTPEGASERAFIVRWRHDLTTSPSIRVKRGVRRQQQLTWLVASTVNDMEFRKKQWTRDGIASKNSCKLNRTGLVKLQFEKSNQKFCGELSDGAYPSLFLRPPLFVLYSAFLNSLQPVWPPSLKDVTWRWPPVRVPAPVVGLRVALAHPARPSRT